MSQDSFNILNMSRTLFRSAINTALQALASRSSGSGDPATMYPYQQKADTTRGVLMRRNSGNTGWINEGPLADVMVPDRTSNSQLGAGDMGRTIRASGTWTQTFAAVATLGDGWNVHYVNVGSGVITLDPNGSETIDGDTTIQLAPGEGVRIDCNGSVLTTVGRAAKAAQNQAYQAFTASGTAPAYTLTPVPALTAYTAGQRFRVKFAAAGTTGSNTLAVSGLSALSLKQYDSTGAKVAGVVTAGLLTDVEYDGTDFVMLDALPVSGFTVASTAEALAGTGNTKAITPLRLREALNAGGSAPIYACRAWVSFSGAGTVAIRASGNVSSITDNGTGDYTVNLVSSMPDANYSVSGVVGSLATASVMINGCQVSARTASGVRIGANTYGSMIDPEYVDVNIFR